MNEKVLNTLEYDKIRRQLAEYAFSEAAKARCADLQPLTEKTSIEQLQRETGDALGRILRSGNLSFSGVRNITDSVRRLEIGGTLAAAELLRICSLLEAARRARSFARQCTAHAGRAEQETTDETQDSLTASFAQLAPLTPLYDEIRRCILSEDEIADDASSTLRSIRRRLHGMNDKIRSQMNAMINNSATRSYLQDGVITMRDGRYCLPVKAEAKSQIPGMIHDQSQSGSTFFIEPMAVVNLNNEYKELLLREQEEIDVILATLSSQAGTYTDELSVNYHVLTELDFIFARAAFAASYNGVAPQFNENGHIDIRKGRHPLLDKKKLCPSTSGWGMIFPF